MGKQVVTTCLRFTPGMFYFHNCKLYTKLVCSVTSPCWKLLTLPSRSWGWQYCRTQRAGSITPQ